MNIPKFRAYVPDQKYMGEVSYINFTDKELSFGVNKDQEELLFDFKDCILIQSTGLSDKNGVEIFCDDIVKVEMHGISSIHKVYWGDDYPAFELIPDLGCECNGFSYINAENVSIEVIGNIHENGDLLNG